MLICGLELAQSATFCHASLSVLFYLFGGDDKKAILSKKIVVYAKWVVVAQFLSRGIEKWRIRAVLSKQVLQAKVKNWNGNAKFIFILK